MTASLIRGLPESRRGEAAALFRARGLPTRRVENWKYSDLRAALGESGFAETTAAWSASMPAGVERIDLARDAAPDWVRAYLGSGARHVMSAASLAFAAGGAAFRVPAGVRAEAPLTLDVSEGGHLRLLLVVEEGASLTLVESAASALFRNVGFDIVLGEGARLDHVRLAPAAPGSVAVEEIAVTAAGGAVYRAHFAGFGAKLSRVALDIVLGGAGAEAHLSGVSVLDGKTHADVTSHVTHAVGGTVSTQLFKHVAAGAGRAVYQGKVTVAEGANGSDSNQTAKALLLGDAAEANLKPELEIFADDVKCAHGAAVGDLDAESLFYLRARGIPEGDARRLLLHAFLADAVAEIADGATREKVGAMVAAALEAGT
jgi:Fe-S cluster assembly protein SufD